MAAIAVVDGLVSDDTVRHVAKTFGGVEHRIELVRIKNGVRYYNDSIASSPSRTIAGLRSFPEKVILIAGGYDKHIPYDVLGPEVCDHVKKLFLCGATAPQIRAAVENCAGEKPEMMDCGDFERAVRAAAAAAESGDVVLMSPASASFDQFKNFMVRGECFKKIIMEL
jgi:UDP-N-acetylmuramoylalanine--D-glutamate ligase